MGRISIDQTHMADEFALPGDFNVDQDPNIAAGTGAEQDGEVVSNFEELYRAAYTHYANIAKLRKDPEADFVENADLIEIDREDAYDFLYRIGQPDVRQTFNLEHETYQCDQLYDDIVDYGIDSSTTCEQLSSLLGIVTITRSLGQEFFGAQYRGQPGEMTHIVLGHVQDQGKSSIVTAIETKLTDEQTQFFAANPDTLFTTSYTLELVDAESKQWCKDIFTHVSNLISLGSRQFLGAKINLSFDDPSPTVLRVKFQGKGFEPVVADNFIFFLTQLSTNFIPFGFTTAWKWDVSFEDILNIPLKQLLNTEVSMSLPTLGIKPNYLNMIRQVAPVETIGLSFEELEDKIPGLRDVVSGNLNTTLDLRQFVEQFLVKFLGEGFGEKTPLDLLVSFAPIAFNIIIPFLGKNLTLKDVLSGLKSLAALGRLIFARDFNNFTSFAITVRSGHSLSFDSHNVFKVEALFKAMDQFFTQLDSIVDKFEKENTPANA